MEYFRFPFDRSGTAITKSVQLQTSPTSVAPQSRQRGQSQSQSLPSRDIDSAVMFRESGNGILILRNPDQGPGPARPTKGRTWSRKQGQAFL